MNLRKKDKVSKLMREKILINERFIKLPTTLNTLRYLMQVEGVDKKSFNKKLIFFLSSYSHWVTNFITKISPVTLCL